MRPGNGLVLAPFPALLLVAAVRTALASDCNQNGIDDAVDLDQPILLHRVSDVMALGSEDPVAVFAADLDGDGRVDVATANSSSDVSIVWNEGQAGFTLGAESFPLGCSPTALTGADLDADGDVDLAAACSSGIAVTVLGNAGARTFRPHAQHPLTGKAVDLAAADMNGDLLPDLAVLQGVDGAISILLNRGNGDLAEVDSDPTHQDAGSLAVADLDRDGDLDAVVAAAFGVDVLFNAGDGGLVRGASVPIGSRPVKVLAADMDSDGDTDLSTVNALEEAPSRGNVSVLINDGSGTFAPPRNFRAGNIAETGAVADFDGDGDVDLITSNGTASLWVLLNTGSGSLLDPFFIALGKPLHDITTADLDGDGDADLAGAGSGKVILLFNDGIDDFVRTDVVVDSELSSFAAGDIDGDGADEIAVVDRAQERVLILKMDDDARLSVAARLRVGKSPSSIELRDLDADDDLDLITSNPGGGNISVLLNQGSGVFGASREYGAGPAPNSVATIDLDGDGDLDIASASPGEKGGLFFRLNDGQGVFAFRLDSGYTQPLLWLLAADFNSDWLPELILGSDHVLLIMVNRGAGTFASPFRINSSGDVHGIASGDIDGNGHRDIAIVRAAHSGLSILWNDGATAFTLDNVAYTSISASCVAIGDVDRDGDTDLIVGKPSQQGSTAIIHVNDGVRTFWTSEVPLPRPPIALAVGDFDADGNEDLVALHRIWLSVALNASPRPEETQSRDRNGNNVLDECEPRFFQRGDTNQDDRIDVADALSSWSYLFDGGPAPGCLDAADVDDDGRLGISDIIYTLRFLFQGGAKPVHPWSEPCGVDTSEDALGCAWFTPCM